MEKENYEEEEKILKKNIEIYKDLTQLINPEKIFLFSYNKYLEFLAIFQQKDLISETFKIFSNNFIINKKSNKIKQIGIPFDISSIHLFSPSPNGEFHVIIKNKDYNNLNEIEQSYYIEVIHIIFFKYKYLYYN